MIKKFTLLILATLVSLPSNAGSLQGNVEQNTAAANVQATQQDLSQSDDLNHRLNVSGADSDLLKSCSASDHNAGLPLTVVGAGRATATVVPMHCSYLFPPTSDMPSNPISRAGSLPYLGLFGDVARFYKESQSKGTVTAWNLWLRNVDYYVRMRWTRYAFLRGRVSFHVVVKSDGQITDIAQLGTCDDIDNGFVTNCAQKFVSSLSGNSFLRFPERSRATEVHLNIILLKI